MERGLQRGMEVTRQILEYAEAGHLRSGSDSVNVGASVSRCLGDHHAQLAERRIEVVVDVPDDILALTRPQHLETILRNLIDNAQHALQHRAAKAPSLLQIRARQDAEHGQVVLDVEDNGEGVPAEMAGRIFEPFFSTKGAAGTGLGLGMSRKLARLYGGDLQLQDKATPGAKFSLTLPLDQRDGPRR